MDKIYINGRECVIEQVRSGWFGVCAAELDETLVWLDSEGKWTPWPEHARLGLTREIAQLFARQHADKPAAQHADPPAEPSDSEARKAEFRESLTARFYPWALDRDHITFIADDAADIFTKG